MGKANFGIILDHPAVYAGSFVSGKVFLDVNKEIKGSHMTLEFYGKEWTEVRYTETYTTGTGNNRTTHTRTRYAHGSRQLVHVSVPLQNLSIVQSGRIPMGKYIVPFQIQVPSFLPSTMRYSGGDGYCKISYEIKSIIKGSGFFVNYNASHAVQIVAAPSFTGQLIPYNGEPVTTAVNLCCCCNRGTMTLGAYMDTTVIEKGRAATVHFACRNHSSVPVDSVTVRVIQKCHWNAGGRSANSTRTLFQTTFDKQHMREALERVTKDETNRTRSVDSLRNERLTIMEELRVGQNKQIAVIPMDSHVTYVGEIIKIAHELRLTVQTDCCIDNPEVRIPLLISEPRPVVPPPSQPTTTTTNMVAPTAPPSTGVPITTGIPLVDPVAIPTPPLPTAPMESSVPVATGMSSDGASIPFAQATVLPNDFTNTNDNDPSDNVIYAQAVCIETDINLTGGVATLESSDTTGQPSAPVEPSTTTTTVPSATTLVTLMKDSIGDVEIIQQKLNDPAWKSFFATLTSSDFATILSKVESSFDRPTVAVLMAKAHTRFTCQHVASAIKIAASWNRTLYVEQLVEYCIDLVENQKTIISVLTEWEKSVTEQAIANAMEQRRKTAK